MSAKIATEFDCVVKFAHAAWRNRIASVFVDGAYCGQIKVVHDTEVGAPVNFGSTDSWLRDDIVAAYGVTSDELKANGGDIFKWATYPGGGGSPRSTVEFRNRYRKK